MHRVHCPTLDFDLAFRKGEFDLDDDAAHRFVRVLRLQDGEQVEVFGAGKRVSGILRLTPQPRLVDVEALPAAVELNKLMVAQAMTKTSKLEDVVRRAAELGASTVFLYVAARTQGREKNPKRVSAMGERLQRIADDTSRQCGRAEVCRVLTPVPFAGLVDEIQHHGGVCTFGLLGANRTLSAELAAREKELRQGGMLVVIGPEGGLSDVEVDTLVEVGSVGVKLAAHTLRTETAGLAALAAAQVILGTL